MKVQYDPQTDTLTMLLCEAIVEESDEINEGVIVDYDKEGRIVGMEILDASRRMDNPASMEFVVKAA